MELRPIDPSSFDQACALLAASHLPVDDLRDPAITLIGAFVDATLVGVIGLQSCDGVALLRSLVVDPQRRDGGVARSLCDRVFALARERRIPVLYLLTESADGYFARLDFRVVDRAEVPAAIRATSQFSALCPSSARVMMRPLP